MSTTEPRPLPDDPTRHDWTCDCGPDCPNNKATPFATKEQLAVVVDKIDASFDRLNERFTKAIEVLARTEENIIRRAGQLEADEAAKHEARRDDAIFLNLVAAFASGGQNAEMAIHEATLVLTLRRRQNGGK